MIEKLSEYEITSRDGGAFINVECNTKIINTLVRKLNEAIDWINDVSALRVTDKQITANLPNIDAGELTFLSKKNNNLKDKVEKLQKQLERAKLHLGCIKNNYNNWTPDRDDYMRAHAANCLAEIKELEDGNL